MMKNTSNLINKINKFETIGAYANDGPITEVVIYSKESGDALFGFNDDSCLDEGDFFPKGDFDNVSPWEFAWALNACAYVCKQNEPYQCPLPIVYEEQKKLLSVAKGESENGTN